MITFARRATAGQGLGGVGDLRQAQADLLVVGLAGRGKYRLPIPPFEQQYAQVLFKQADMAADGAVGDMQLFGSTAEALMARGRGKGPDRVHGEVADHVSNLLTSDAQLKRLSAALLRATLNAALLVFWSSSMGTTTICSADRASLRAALILSLCLPGDVLLYLLLPMQYQAFGITLGEAGILLAANRLVRIFGYHYVMKGYARWGSPQFDGGGRLRRLCALGYATLSGFWALLLLRLLWGWPMLR